jgi:hypothetical protein
MSDLALASSSRVIRGENNKPYDETDLDFLGSFLSCPAPLGVAHVKEFHLAHPTIRQTSEFINTVWSRVQFALRLLDSYCALSGGCSARTDRGHETWWVVGDVASYLLGRITYLSHIPIFVHCNQDFSDNSKIMCAFKQKLRTNSRLWYFLSPYRLNPLPFKVFPIPLDFTKYRRVQTDQALFELDLFGMYCMAVQRGDFERVAIRFHGDELDALYTTRDVTLDARVTLRYMDMANVRPMVRRRADHGDLYDPAAFRPKGVPSLMQLAVFTPLVTRVFPRMYTFWSDEPRPGEYNRLEVARECFNRPNNPWSRFVDLGLQHWDLYDSDVTDPYL